MAQSASNLYTPPAIGTSAKSSNALSGFSLSGSTPQTTQTPQDNSQSLIDAFMAKNQPKSTPTNVKITHPNGLTIETKHASDTPSTIPTKTVPTPASQGQSFTDTQGNQVSASQNKFDPMTGKAYSAPTGENGMAPASTSTPAPGLYSQYTQKLAQTSSQPTADYTNAQDRTRQAYQDAANTNQIIARSESDALHNPNYNSNLKCWSTGLYNSS